MSSGGSALALVAVIDAGAAEFKRKLDAYFQEKRRRAKFMNEVDAHGGDAIPIGVRKQHQNNPGRPETGRNILVNEIETWREKSGSFFLADTTRKKLKKVDDEMEAFRFFR